MVSIEELASLDLQLWLRSGEEAANRLHCAQSTISRRNIETLRHFNVSMKRSDGEWRLYGNKAFLNLERQSCILLRQSEVVRSDLGTRRAVRSVGIH